MRRARTTLPTTAMTDGTAVISNAHAKKFMNKLLANVSSCRAPGFRAASAGTARDPAIAVHQHEDGDEDQWAHHQQAVMRCSGCSSSSTSCRSTPSSL